MYLNAVDIPMNTHRVFIFANTHGVHVDRLGLTEGDLCIHLNRAIYAEEAKKIHGVTHNLIVRWREKHDGGCEWCAPNSFDDYWQVTFWGHNAYNTPKWLQDYSAVNPGKYPTTGFVAYNCVMDARPDLPVFLVGFRPWEDTGTRWEGHAWDYESYFYLKNNAITI